ncbi:MAG: hypothetical protein ACUZ8N_04925 [Candidatus Scalindua sp.]
MADICKKCGQSRSYSEGFGKLKCSDRGTHDYSPRESGDPPAKASSSSRKEVEFPHEQQAEVIDLIRQVKIKLRTINQQSLSGGHTADNELLWHKIKDIGEELKAVGGTKLLKDAIIDIRREQTLMGDQLELMWLGKRVRRLP